MNPAPSVIAFTTLSGAGFGLLVFLGLGWPAPTGWAAFAGFALAYGLAVGGLLASTLHLGHPERALLAFTQWRTSWLSREAWASCAALLLMAPHAAALTFLATPLAPLGWLAALACLATVTATGMIYGCLRAVPRWHHWTTPALYLGWSLAGGALLAGHGRLAAPLLLIAGALQAAHWITGDRRFAASGATLATATGLGPGAVRSFAAPHTGENYLLREMVYVVARRRAVQLRALGLTLGALLPALLALVPGAAAGLAAALLHLAGVAATRWLFFAEAEHTTGLYYGRR